MKMAVLFYCGGAIFYMQKALELFAIQWTPVNRNKM